MSRNSWHLIHSRIERLETQYTWKLDGFLSYKHCSIGKVIKSNHFNTKFEGLEQVWHLEINPCVYQNNKEGYVSLHLYCDSDCTINYKLSVLDESDKELRALRGKMNTSYKKILGTPDFLSRDELFRDGSKLLVNGSLTILCVISQEENKTIPLIVDRSTSHLSRDLGDLLKSSRLSDLTITVGERKFHVHRNILAARSPVLSAMFEHDFKEKSLGKVDIPDIDPKTMEALLKFIYTGEYPNAGDMAEDLLRASNKYQMDELKDICSDDLLARVTADNASSLLLTADLHNAEKLKENVLEFVIQHFRNVRISEGWKNLSTANSSLSEEVKDRVIEHLLQIINK